jgi:hypothetical protein
MRKRHFTRQVGLILSERTYEQLIEQTDREEVSISEWIRSAIEKKLFGEKKEIRNERKHFRKGKG